MARARTSSTPIDRATAPADGAPTAASRRPTDAATLVVRHAEVLLGLGRHGEAAALAEAWLAGAPADHAVRLLHGQALYESGAADAALAALSGLPAGLPGLAKLRRAAGLAAGDLPIGDAPPSPETGPRGRPGRSPERVVAEGDLGETIAFARFLPALAAKERPIVAEVPAVLVPVLGGLGGSVVWRARGDTTAAPDGSPSPTPLITVPHRLGLDTDRLAAAAQPLKPDSARAAVWARRLGPDGYRIGVVWQASADPAAAVPAIDLLPLTRLVGVRPIALQQGRAAVDLRLERGLTGISDIGSDIAETAEGMVDLAAILDHLDAVVAVDSVVAHLAAALGKPVALLVKAPGADWLWPPGRDTSPFYASLRVFRQTRPGDWSGAIAAAIDWLQRRRGGAGPAAIDPVAGPKLIPAALPVGPFFTRLADISARLAETAEPRVRSGLIVEQHSLQGGWQRLGLDQRPLAALTAAAGDLARRRRDTLRHMAELEAAGDHGADFVAAARLLLLLERERDRLEQAIDQAGTRRLLVPEDRAAAEAGEPE